MRHASPIKWYATEPLTLLLVLLLPAVAAAWLAADAPCHIRATLYVTPASQRSEQDFGLPLDIDCSDSGNAGAGAAAFDLGAQRVAGKQHVRLNGSQAPPLLVASYGLEYLDNCLQLQSVEIERFVLATNLPLSCSFSLPLKHLTSVSLRGNELGTLSGESFSLVPHLQQLHLEDNSLRLLKALENCTELQQLIIRRERLLSLRQAEVLQQLEQLQRLELTQLKLISGDVLEALPGQLTELLVKQTPIEPRQLCMGNGTEQLIQLSLVECDLTSFSLDATSSSKLLHLNLSGNALRQLQLANSSLLTLDLSGNHLRCLNSSWFVQLEQLQQLNLQRNELFRLSWLQLMQLAPRSLLQLDLSSNELLRLEDTQNASWDQAQQLSIQIDDNPWSCQWLLNFSHAQPQLFRLFRYAKYISQINVNGLSCNPQQEEATPEPSSGDDGRWATNHDHLNVSTHTVLYGNPVEQPRSQRTEALIIVFMLPVGIALLFLLLYLYLHCERIFHWSYYSSGLPCFGGGKVASNHRFVDHIDIVRYPIANGNSSPNIAEELEPQADGYETPLSGSASICNCAGQRQSTCSRTHHVTYEVMPTELPYELYTEIKEPNQNEEEAKGGEMSVATAPIYDHLSFEEEKPFEV